MFVCQTPLFKRGRILKEEMLVDISNYPRSVLNIQHQHYGDGIVVGCSIGVQQEYLVIEPGMLSYRGNCYLLSEMYRVDYHIANCMMYLKVRFLEETQHKDFKRSEGIIVLEANETIMGEEIELCRFNLRTGAKLRNTYVDFKDLSTLYDTIQIIHTPFAVYEETTLSPQLLTIFAKEAFQYTLKDPIDITFCMNILQEYKPIRRQLIISYINQKLNVNSEQYINQQLYQALLDILSCIRQGGDAQRGLGGRTRSIFVD